MKLKSLIIGLILTMVSTSFHNVYASTKVTNIPVMHKDGVLVDFKPVQQDTLIKPVREPEKVKISNFAVAGFLAGGIGTLLTLFVGAYFGVFVFGTILVLLGMIFSIIGLSETYRGKLGRGFAYAGIVLSTIGIFLSSLFYLLLLMFGF